MKRTQEEILARYLDGEDTFGWRGEVLIPALDYEYARPFLKDGITEAEWLRWAHSHEHLTAEAEAYYGFAVSKIRDHRGISAERSVEKLTEYAWLLGRDDVVEAMNGAEYEQYGAPKVKAFGDGFGLEWADGEPELQRMAEGLPCEPGCTWGCDQ